MDKEKRFKEIMAHIKQANSYQGQHFDVAELVHKVVDLEERVEQLEHELFMFKPIK